MNQVYGITQQLCERVGSLVAMKVWYLIETRDWVTLQGVNLDPSLYSDAEAFWADAMCVNLLRKAYIPESGVSTAAAAVDTFLKTERVCAVTNQRVRTIVSNSGLTSEDMAFGDLLDRWKEKIRAVLGPLPKILVPKFSTGATTTTKRLSSTIPDKLSGRIETYSHSTWEVDSLLKMTGWWDSAERDDTPTRARANEYFTVNKTGLTDRSCCKEAVGNCALQLAVGLHIRGCLSLSMGIDLNHGARHHMLRARLASITGREATIDLTSASDLWSREIVRYVLPTGWRDLLNSLRATHTSFGGKLLYLEKFSSMGNGFTFELETLLFSTLIESVLDRLGESWIPMCYGDDLIVPSSAAEHVLQALRLVGHTPNERKTFLEGPFRESCGGDYYSGTPVNTVKLEQLPEEPQHWISFANNLRRVIAGGNERRRWALVRPVWDAVIRQLPNQIRRARGPSHLGDIVIHDRPPEGGWPEWVTAYVPVCRKTPIFGRANFTPTALMHYVINFASSDSDPRTLSGDVVGFKLSKRYSRAFSDWIPGVKFTSLSQGERRTIDELGWALSHPH